jgi:hypothetical protein
MAFLWDTDVVLAKQCVYMYSGGNITRERLTLRITIAHIHYICNRGLDRERYHIKQTTTCIPSSIITVGFTPLIR